MAEKTLEEKLNEFYSRAAELTFILDIISKTEEGISELPEKKLYIEGRVKKFVENVQSSFDLLKKRGYNDAWDSLQEVCVGFIDLCSYKERRSPNLQTDLSRRCSEAYIALPEKSDEPISLSSDLLNEWNIEKIKQGYSGIIGQVESMPLIKGQPTDVTPLTEEEFEKLRLGDKIFIRNKFGGDPNWYGAEVTRSPLPESIVPAIYFKITDTRHPIKIRTALGGPPLGEEEPTFIYYSTDAMNVAYQTRTPK